MSYIFDDPNDTTVWNPSLKTGQLFMAIANNLAEAIDSPTGLEELASDWYRVNPPIFKNFIGEVFAKTWNGRVRKELSRGFIATSLVILERCGQQVSEYVEKLELDTPLSVEALRRHV